ncbi:hypothetical protein BD626DRAFT_147762 [Schizophyllum amplum]|uniref:Uncharacterized protein n=1 Tax=Schizophyllum amplum TaxID=97359 RepID=A0A550C4P2_9AGAR|nr:hypothetical protein BD626DRAFT_147762 [Auriculariopsis ampla]
MVYKSRGTWGDRGSTPAFSPSSLTCPPVVGFFLPLSLRRRRPRLDLADLASASPRPRLDLALSTPPPFRAYSPPPPASSTASCSRPTVALDDAQHLLFVGEVEGHCVRGDRDQRGHGRGDYGRRGVSVEDVTADAGITVGEDITVGDDIAVGEELTAGEEIKVP